MVACKVFKENSNPLRLNTVFLLEQIEKFPREQQDILFGMGRGNYRIIANILTIFRRDSQNIKPYQCCSQQFPSIVRFTRLSEI